MTYCPACVLADVVELAGVDLGLDLTQSMEVDRGQGQPIPPGENVPELQAGDVFGDYEIVGKLGRGGMGVVYEADHLPTARRVALKVMSHSWQDRVARGRFLREGRLAASINHPNSVYVYGTEEIQDRPAISMELVSGRTLGEVVKADGPMSPREAVDAILQVIDGLEAAATVGVLHRDVKPNNCFVDNEGRIKVGDFGLSISTLGQDSVPQSQRSQATHVTEEGTFLGTPAYASPEQLRGEPLDHRSDIYALGVTLYYLISGRVPFAAENMVQLLARVLDTEPPTLAEVADNIDVDLVRVVRRCLAKSPGGRFASYEALRQELLPHSSQVPEPAPLGVRSLAMLIGFRCAAHCLYSPQSVCLSIRSDASALGFQSANAINDWNRHRADDPFGLLCDW